LILPVVFDDTREEEIKPKFAKTFEDEKTVELLKQTGLGMKLLDSHIQRSNTQNEFGVIKMTAQERVEKTLHNWLMSRWKIWRLRPKARGEIFLQLYYFRNFVFRINPQSKRPKILGRYVVNMKALDTILGIADKTGVEVLVYIVPIRKDIETPYIQDEYTQFKREIEQLADTYHVWFANLESLIPAEFWGR
jgi:hypothetical protein